MIKIHYSIDNSMNLFQFDLFNNINSFITAHVAASMIPPYEEVDFIELDPRQTLIMKMNSSLTMQVAYSLI